MAAAALRSRQVAKESLYLERQKRMLCGVHAVNNFLQVPAFSLSIYVCVSTSVCVCVWQEKERGRERGGGRFG
jgi:hypothetical protein